MPGELWLEQLARAVRAQIEYVEVSPVDRGTMTLTLGAKGVVVHLAGEEKDLLKCICHNVRMLLLAAKVYGLGLSGMGGEQAA